jgi:IS6 family transposase
MQNNRSALFRGRHFAEEIIVLCVRWYLRFSLSYRDLEELMTERGLSVDHTTVWRWVQRYAPELDRRVRRELKRTGTSWRVDETYIRVAGRWMYLYRALDSCGATLDFYLSENRNAAAAKQFLGKVLASANHPRPRVINVDGNPSYPHAVSRLKQEGRLGRRCRCRTSLYLNNIIEQDHRALKRRINAKQGFRSLEGARRTIPGYEVMHMIRKGQVRWLLKGDVGGQVLFINSTLGLKTA